MHYIIHYLLGVLPECPEDIEDYLPHLPADFVLEIEGVVLLIVCDRKVVASARPL